MTICADDVVLERPPVAERDEGTGRNRSSDRERAEPDSVENDAKNVLAKHLTVHAQTVLTRRVAYSLRSNKDFDAPVLGASLRVSYWGDRRVRALALDVERAPDR